MRCNVASSLSLLLAAGLAQAAPVRYKLDPNHTQSCWRAGTTSATPTRSPISARSTARSSTTPTRSTPPACDVTLPLSGLDSFVPTFDQAPAQRRFLRCRQVADRRLQEHQGREVARAKLKVTGDLTIRDVTKPVVLDVTLNKAGRAATASRGRLRREHHDQALANSAWRSSCRTSATTSNCGSAPKRRCRSRRPRRRPSGEGCRRKTAMM